MGSRRMAEDAGCGPPFLLVGARQSCVPRPFECLALSHLPPPSYSRFARRALVRTRSPCVGSRYAQVCKAVVSFCKIQNVETNPRWWLVHVQHVWWLEHEHVRTVDRVLCARCRVRPSTV